MLNCAFAAADSSGGVSNYHNCIPITCSQGSLTGANGTRSVNTNDFFSYHIVPLVICVAAWIFQAAIFCYARPNIAHRGISSNVSTIGAMTDTTQTCQ